MLYEKYLSQIFTFLELIELAASLGKGINLSPHKARRDSFGPKVCHN